MDHPFGSIYNPFPFQKRQPCVWPKSILQSILQMLSSCNLFGYPFETVCLPRAFKTLLSHLQPSAPMAAWDPFLCCIPDRATDPLLLSSKACVLSCLLDPLLHIVRTIKLLKVFSWAVSIFFWVNLSLYLRDWMGFFSPWLWFTWWNIVAIWFRFNDCDLFFFFFFFFYPSLYLPWWSFVWMLIEWGFIFCVPKCTWWKPIPSFSIDDWMGFYFCFPFIDELSVALGSVSFHWYCLIWIWVLSAEFGAFCMPWLMLMVNLGYGFCLLSFEHVAYDVVVNGQSVFSHALD